MLKGEALRRAIDGLIFGLLVASGVIQAMLLATDYQTEVNLKPELGNFPIGFLALDIEGQMYQSMAYAAMIFVSAGATLALVRGHSRILAGIAISLFVIGALFGGVIPIVQQDFWLPAMIGAAVFCLITIFGRNVRLYQKQSAPDYPPAAAESRHQIFEDRSV